VLLGGQGEEVINANEVGGKPAEYDVHEARQED